MEDLSQLVKETVDEAVKETLSEMEEGSAFKGVSDIRIIQGRSVEEIEEKARPLIRAGYNPSGGVTFVNSPRPTLTLVLSGFIFTDRYEALFPTLSEEEKSTLPLPSETEEAGQEETEPSTDDQKKEGLGEEGEDPKAGAVEGESGSEKGED